MDWKTFFQLLLAIIGLVLWMLKWLWGDERQIRRLDEAIKKKEKQYAKALADNDTVSMSCLSADLAELREERSHFKK